MASPRSFSAPSRGGGRGRGRPRCARPRRSPPRR
jgi:hypothetical protein